MEDENAFFASFASSNEEANTATKEILEEIVETPIEDSEINKYVNRASQKKDANTLRFFDQMDQRKDPKKGSKAVPTIKG